MHLGLLLRESVLPTFRADRNVRATCPLFCVCADIQVILSAIALNVTEPVNCQALYTYNQVPSVFCGRSSQSNLHKCRFLATLLLA